MAYKNKIAFRRYVSYLICMVLIVASVWISTDMKTEASGDSLELKLSLDGFTTYGNNNYAFEFNDSTGYENATDLFENCIKKGFAFKLTNPMTTLSLLGVKMGTVSKSSGNFRIGDGDGLSVDLNFKAGTGDGDWNFSELKPDIYYHEVFESVDGATRIVICDKNATDEHGTNFKQVFIKGIQSSNGATITSELITANQDVEIYDLVATIEKNTIYYRAYITHKCTHPKTMIMNTSDYPDITNHYKDAVSVKMCAYCMSVVEINNGEENTTEEVKQEDPDSTEKDDSKEENDPDKGKSDEIISDQKEESTTESDLKDSQDNQDEVDDRQTPPKVKIRKAKRKNTKLTFYWSKPKTKEKQKLVSGYEVRYSYNKNFSKSKTKVVKNKNKTKLTVKGIKKKFVYVKIRSYRIVKINGVQTKIYSKWSKKKIKL